MTAPLTPEQIADVLDDAADYIERYGWDTNTPPAWKYGEPGCAMASIRAAEREADRRFYAVTPAVRALGALLPAQEDETVVTRIWRFNDTPGRTKQEVLDAFRAAAKQQRPIPRLTRPAAAAPPRSGGRAPPPSNRRPAGLPRLASERAPAESENEVSNERPRHSDPAQRRHLQRRDHAHQVHQFRLGGPRHPDRVSALRGQGQRRRCRRLLS